MDNTLTPRLIIISGIPAAGKTTLAEALARAIPNAIYLSRDHIAYGGLLYVNEKIDTPTLPSFKEYVALDKVFPNDAESIDTPFGAMTLIHDSARSDFYKRHMREQGYLIMGRLAERNMLVGKVAIIEGFLPRSIMNGTLRVFMDQPAFGAFEKYLIYVVADSKVLFSRQKHRAMNDYEAATRAKIGYLEEEDFAATMEREHPQFPKELETYKHLPLDTSRMSIQQMVARTVAYITKEKREEGI